MGLTKISGGVIQSDNFSVGVITATSVNTSGVVTATTVQIGAATTVHTTGIDLGSGNITSHNINSTGIITAASFGAINGTTASFSGDVSVGGVLTYDDVTNIDSIGVVTARSGVHVTGVGASVGIGTDNPAKKLDVVGDTKLYGTVIVGDSTDISPTALGAGQLQIDTNGYTPYIAADGTAMHIGHNSSLRDLKLQTNETDRLTINGSTGNIGIGTDSPSAPISIKVGSDGEYVQDFRGTSDKQFGFFYDQHSWNQATFRIDEFDSNGTATPRLTIYNGGNIGIGSTLPTQALDVIGRISKTEYEPGEIIERLCAVCDGSTHVVKSGSYTMANVTFKSKQDQLVMQYVLVVKLVISALQVLKGFIMNIGLSGKQ